MVSPRVIFFRHSTGAEMPRELLLTPVGDVEVGTMYYYPSSFRIPGQMVRGRPGKMRVSGMGMTEGKEANVWKCRVIQAFQGSIQDNWCANNRSTANPCA